MYINLCALLSPEFVKIYMSEKLPFKEQLNNGEVYQDTVKSDKAPSSSANHIARKSSAKKPSHNAERPKTGNSVLTPRHRPSVDLTIDRIDRPKTSRVVKAPAPVVTSNASGGAFSYYRDEDEDEDSKKTAKKTSVWDRLSQPSARTRPQHASQQKY